MATYYIGAQAFGINSLAHAIAPNKGWKKPNAKYIERYMGRDGKWQYVYEKPSPRISSGVVRNIKERETRRVSRRNRMNEASEADRYDTSRTAANRRVSTLSGLRSNGPASYDVQDERRRDERRRMAVEAQLRNQSVANKVASRNSEIEKQNVKRAKQLETEAKINEITSSAKETINKGQSFITGLFNKIAGFAKDAYGKVSSLAKTAWSTVKRVGGDIIERGRKFLKKAFGAVRDFATGESANALYRQMRSDGVPEDAARRASGIDNTLPGMVSNAKTAVRGAAKNVGTAVGGAAKNVGKAVSGAAQNVGSAVSSAAESIGSGARSVANAATTTAFKALPNSTQQSALSAIKSDYDKAVSEYQRLLGDKNASDEDKNAARDRMYALQQTYNMYYNAHEADVFKD